jgi:hypothetical protein
MENNNRHNTPKTDGQIGEIITRDYSPNIPTDQILYDNGNFDHCNYAPCSAEMIDLMAHTFDMRQALEDAQETIAYCLVNLDDKNHRELCGHARKTMATIKSTLTKVGGTIVPTQLIIKKE